MVSKNNKWFTLVELIIVITILAILATIAFISFGSYSSDARDSKRLNDLQTISKQIEIKKTWGSSYVDMVWTETSWYSWNLAIAWYATWAITNTAYKVGTANFQLLWIEQGKFKDDLYASDYVVAWINIWSTIAFQLAAKLEAWWTPKSLIVGNYIPRTMTWTSSNWTISSDKITLTSNFWVFKKWDLIKWNTSWSWVVNTLTPDMKILTVSWSLVWTTFSLNSNETSWLIFSSSSVVTDWSTTVFPY